MRFLALATMLTAVSAADIVQLAATELNNIQMATEGVTRLIKTYSAGNTDVLTQIVNANTQIIGVITNATAMLKANTQSIDTTGAFDIGASTQYLAYAVNASIAALIDKKEAFGPVLLSTVVGNLQMQVNASNSFSGALIPKTPAATRPIADALNSQVTDSLQMGIECFGNKMNSSCNPAVVDPKRTEQAARDTGATLPKKIVTNAAPGRLSSSIGTLTLAALVVAALSSL